ncbi:MAG: hypothetical protein Q9166_005547 [cf. Caloplaca sp. 2 TL-2023]
MSQRPSQFEATQTDEHDATQHRQSAPSRSVDDTLLPPPPASRQNGLGPTSHRACLSDTPATTAPNSPKMPPRRQDSGLSSSSTRSRPTTLDIPGLTKSKVSPDGRIAQRDVGSKLVIVMVGLPARGKSYVTKKMARYLNWLQHDTKIFNVGEKRRVATTASAKPTPGAQNGNTRFPDFDQLHQITPASFNHMLSQRPLLDSPTPSARVLVNGELPSDQLSTGDLPPPALDVLAPSDVDPGLQTYMVDGHYATFVRSTDVPQANGNDASHDHMDHSANFFDPENTEAAELREQLAMETLDELLDFLLYQNGSVGIFDATNSTLERRKNIMNKIRQRAGPELGVLFLESQCIDDNLLESNMRLKLSGPDYKDQDPVTALADFKKRVALYEKAYIPLGEYEERNNMSYVQMIDVGRKVVSHQIRGFLSAQTVYYLLNFNLSPRQIWITRHGESYDNLSGKIGGDSDLSPTGLAYASALTRFIQSERKAWDVRQQDRAASTHFPPQPGDTTPPNPECITQCDGNGSYHSKSFCVWTSMLKRSIQTAQYFDEEDFDIKQMRMLDELNAGAMEGLTYEEIKTKHPVEYEIRRNDKLHYRYPGAGGESYLDIINRLRAVIVEVERMTDHVLLVGHRSVARVLLAYFKGLKREEVADLDVPLGTLYMLEPKPYGVDFKAYRYNPRTDWFDYVPDYRLRRATFDGELLNPSLDACAATPPTNPSINLRFPTTSHAAPLTTDILCTVGTVRIATEQLLKKLLIPEAFKAFPTLTEAERYLAGENLTTGGSATATKFYAVKSGHVPGIYTDWPSAQDQITGWQKPKHRSFATRAEAQWFLDEGGPTTEDSPEATEVESTVSSMQYLAEPLADSIKPPAPKKAKKTLNGPSKGLKQASIEYNEAYYAPGTGPLPPGAEDGFDPNITLDPVTGDLVYKTFEQRQATKPHPAGPASSGMLRIHTDGSALGNGQAGAFAGVGVYFGPGDKRNLSETLPGPRQTNQRAELTAILRALEIVPKNRDVSIITDSKYAIDCVTDWHVKWRRNGWKTTGGKTVENKDLVENILSKIEERKSLGVILSPSAANFIRPLEYALGSEEDLTTVTLYFTRLVLCIQLVIAGIQLPSKYLKYEWKSVAWLLGPGMTAMWLSTSLLVWAMIPHLSFLHSLAVGACVTPTDPVLSNSIVKGKFADQNVPKDLQKVIITESGANDGLGYPFLFIALYLIKYTGLGGEGQPGGPRLAMAYWFGETWFYVIVLSVIYGATVGLLASRLLHWAEDRKFVDRESYQVFAIGLALFVVGTCGMIGSDDVLASFIAGNAFNFDDRFRLKTIDDSLQQTTDMLLNYAVFAWFGAVCPWSLFAQSEVIPIYRLISLGILVLLFRRIPMIYALQSQIWQIQGWQQMLFTGFFGPIGVSAVFYLYVSLDFLRHVTVDGVMREDAASLGEVITVVVWFLAICSIVVHGLSVPVGILFFELFRTFSAKKRSRGDIEGSELPEASPKRGQGESDGHGDRHEEGQRKDQHVQGGFPRLMFRKGASNKRSTSNPPEATTVGTSEEASTTPSPPVLEKQSSKQSAAGSKPSQQDGSHPSVESGPTAMNNEMAIKDRAA